MYNYPVVEIIWTDAVHQSGWTEQQELDNPDSDATCVTVGFLVRKPTKKNPFYIVSSTIGLEKDSDVLGVVKIPKIWVKQIKEYPSNAEQPGKPVV